MRPSDLAAAAAAPYDAIIIGGGINGAGIARDAAMRGLRVLLLEKGDLAGGTSAWSSRFIHGGLRYLEHFELGLVYESLAERERLLRIAPHLVRPIPFVVPVYRSSKRGPALVRLGMITYDLLSATKSLDRHRMLGREEALRRLPGLDPEGLRAAALYYDAQVPFAERLVLENALDARRRGATVITYARVTAIDVADDQVSGVSFRDELGGGSYSASAPVVLNVAGAWVDEVVVGLGGPRRRLMGGTKGSHLIVDPFPGAPRDVIYAEARRDGRPYLIIPWNGRYLIGTTDLRYEGDLDHVSADDAEYDYLLAETNALIPGARLTRDDVLYTYSGVRPLPYVPEGATAAITRRHLIHDHGPTARGLYSIVGGKLTTYRSLAAQAVERTYATLGRKAPPCTTHRAPLPGAEGLEEARAALGREGALPAAALDRLLQLYGARAADVVALGRGRPHLLAPLAGVGDSAPIGAEVVHAFAHEGAQTLADVLLRRTLAAYGPRAGLDVDEAAAQVAARELGWGPERVEEELAAFRQWIRRYRPRELAAVPV